MDRRAPRARSKPAIARTQHFSGGAALWAAAAAACGIGGAVTAAIAVGHAALAESAPLGFLIGATIGAAAVALSLLVFGARRAGNFRLDTLQQALNALPDGFVLYDRDDRVVMANRRYRELHAVNPVAWQAGARFEDIFRAGLKAGEIPQAAADSEARILARVARHQNPEAPFEQQSGARWLRISEEKTPDGGVVAIHTDMTAIKAAQADAEATRARMTDFAATASDWFWEADAAGNLTFLSHQF